MAAALIDITELQKLVATQLETVSGLTVVHLGEPEPESSDHWVRFLGLKIRKHKRVRGLNGQPDYADFEAVFLIVTSEAQASQYAIGDAVNRVLAVFNDATLRSSEHQMDFSEPADIEIMQDPDPNRRIRTATVSLSGMAQRITGTSAGTYLNP